MSVKSEAVKKTFDRGARELPPLKVGDSVRIQNHTTTRNKKWDKTGVIMEVLPFRKYTVMVSGSRRLTSRNRRHLRKVPELNPTQKVCSPTQPKGGASTGENDQSSIITTWEESSYSHPHPNSLNGIDDNLCHAESPQANPATPSPMRRGRGFCFAPMQQSSPAGTPLASPHKRGSSPSSSQGTPPASGESSSSTSSSNTPSASRDCFSKTADKASPPAQPQRRCKPGTSSPISNSGCDTTTNADDLGSFDTHSTQIRDSALPLCSRTSGRARKQVQPWQYGKGWSGKRGW